MAKITLAVFACLCFISSCKCSTNNTKQAETVNTDTATVTTISKTDTNHRVNTTLNDTSTVTVEKSMYKKDNYNRPKYVGKTQGEFPEGTDRKLTDKDVDYLSEWGLKVMLNEIYARHGQGFSNDPQLEEHFKREGWYHGYNANVNKALTKTEKANITFLKNYKFKSGVE